MFNLSEKTKNHFYHPQNVGVLDINDPHIRFAKVATPDNHTIMHLYLRIENDIITEAKFKVLGDPFAIACLSFLTEFALNKKLSEIKNTSAEFLIQTLEIPKERYGTAFLVEDLVKKI